LGNLLSAPPPGDGPIGEAWLLSDRDDHPSRVADGPLKGRTVGQLLKQWPEQLLGKLAGRFRRFPLLLKFLDARDMLSVQVHPLDQQTKFHSLGDLVVFEVQENSDVTFRLYDWDHVDAKTGQPRPLQVDQALACIDFAQGAIGPVVPVAEEAKPVLRERLFDCGHFGLWRLRAESPFTVGAEGTSRVLVCIAGGGRVEHDGTDYAVGKGDVLLLPTVVGACLCRPRGAVSLLDISLPEGT
jgi:mannose-6-phosphate isomerase class I